MGGATFSRASTPGTPIQEAGLRRGEDTNSRLVIYAVCLNYDIKNMRSTGPGRMEGNRKVQVELHCSASIHERARTRGLGSAP